MLPDNMDEETAWYFHTLSEVVQDISESWVTVLRMHEDDMSNVCWFVFPAENEDPEDLEESETHPDRVLINVRGGILFLKPTTTPRSQWMAVQLKHVPELAGRVI